MFYPLVVGLRYAILRPEFSMEKHEKPGGHTEYSCRLQLPCNAPFEILEGPLCSSMRLAQQVDLIVFFFKNLMLFHVFSK